MSFQQYGFGSSQLKQNVAYNKSFQLLTSAGVAVTGATVTVSISKAGAAFATIQNGTGAVTEISNGWYSAALAAADTSIQGDLAYNITSSGGSGASVPLSFVDQVRPTLWSDLQLDSSGNAKIASSLKANQPLNGFSFPMTNSTTHLPQIGLTVAAQRSLGGAGFAPCANAVTELSNGIYSINLAATDTNASTIFLRFTAATADDLDILLVTQPS